MRFEEVLPAWRSGRKIRRKGMAWWLEFALCRDEDEDAQDEQGDVLVAHLLADDWEVVEEYEEVEVWDWVYYCGITSTNPIVTGRSQAQIDRWQFLSPDSRLLGRIEESKRVERRRKQ